jgi:uncharacterized membrane protein
MSKAKKQKSVFPLVFTLAGVAGGLYFAYDKERDKSPEDKSFGTYFWYAILGGLGGGIIGNMVAGEDIIKITSK